MSRIKKHKLKKSVAAAEKEQPKKKMSKQMLMTIIIGGLMVISVFGIMFSSYNSSGEEEAYGEYTFQRTARGWALDIDGKKAEFSYHPADLEEMEISGEVMNRLRTGRVFYITFNPNTKNVQKFELMRFELANMMAHTMGLYAMTGISEQNEMYKQPIVDCTNATATLPVVNLIEANETSAYLDGDCIVLEADEYTTAAMKDRLLYGMLGIIE